MPHTRSRSVAESVRHTKASVIFLKGKTCIAMDPLLGIHTKHIQDKSAFSSQDKLLFLVQQYSPSPVIESRKNV